MATTSLFDQLKRLQVPQTSFSVEKRKKVSLLFDSKEAANYDKDTFYSIGAAGLTELIEINPKFEEFKKNLFSENSISFERSVETKEANEKLNKKIKKFLFFLSPYVLLKSARHALEWLVSRYQIHQYNSEDLLFLVLPYHETKTFADVLQILPIGKNNGTYNWLHPLKKKGVPLSKSAIYNRCATDLGFLNLICSNTMAAINAYGEEAYRLTTLFAFYTTTVVGTLEHSTSISEKLVTAIIPSVTMGLGSTFLDFVSSSYIIIARLITKTSINQTLLMEFIIMISKVKHEKHRSDAILLLILVYQLDSINIDKAKLPEKALENILNSRDWFVNVFAALIKSRAFCTPFLLALMRTLLKRLMDDKSPEKEKLIAFMNRLLDTLVLDEDDATQLISTIFKTVKFKKTSKNIKKFLCSYLKRLEKGYPNSWDAAVKMIDSNSRDCVTLRKLLGISSTTSDSDLFEKLIDPNPRVRLEVVSFLLQNGSLDKIKSVESSFAACLYDEDMEVAKAMLTGPQNILTILVTKQNALLLLERWWLTWKNDVDSEIVKQLVNVTKILNDITVNTVFLLFLSKYSKKDVEFSAVLDEFLKSSSYSREEILDHIVNTACSLPPDFTAKPMYLFLYSVLLSKFTSEEKVNDKKLEIFNSLSNSYSSFPKVKLVTKALVLNEAGLRTCMELTQKNELPLDGLFNFVTLAVSKTISSELFSTKEDWLEQNLNDNFHLLLGMFKAIMTGSAEGKKNKSKTNFEGVLSDFIDVFLSQGLSKLYFTCSTLLNVSDEDILFPLGCLKMMTATFMELDGKAESVANSDILDIVFPVLLTLLSHSAADLRSATLDCLKLLTNSLNESEWKKKPYFLLMSEILKKESEIKLDKNQISLILYFLLSPDSDVRSLLPSAHLKPLSNSLECLVTLITSGAPLDIVEKLLSLLAPIHSKEFLLKLIPLAESLIVSLKTAPETKKIKISNCLTEIFLRFNVVSAKCLEEEIVWKFIEVIVWDHKTTVTNNDASTLLCVLLLKQVTPDFFAALPSAIHVKLLTLLVSVSALCENPEVVSAVASVFKHITVDSITILKILEEMKDVTTTLPPNLTPLQKRRFMESSSSADWVTTPEWKKGIALLELIQNKRKLLSSHILLPVLFDLLKKCLVVEEQSSVEYIKQLCLTSILHSYEKILETRVSDSATNDTTMDYSEVIVECIRGSQNPQTHHHALLVLSKMAMLFPRQVVHNVMPLFTFIGSSVLRQDDAYSFQIVFKIIESVIPALLQVSNKHEMAISILRVFASALLDIPEHRRLSLLMKLHETLDNSEYLWIFLVFVIEAYVLHYSLNKPETVSNDSGSKTIKESKHLKYLEELCAELPSSVVLRNFNHLLSYLLALPHTKDDASVAVYKNNIRSKKMIDVFNFVNATDKELRHFKFKTISFISNFIAQQDFVAQISFLNASSPREMRVNLQTFLQHILLYIQLIPNQISSNAKNKSLSKYWETMLSQCHDLLAKITTMLPEDIFLEVISGLLVQEKIELKCKALELLNLSLQKHSNRMSENNEDRFEDNHMLELLPKLSTILKTIGKKNRLEGEDKNSGSLLLLQQECCISVKLLAKYLAVKNPDSFVMILELVCDLVCSKKTIDRLVLANLILCFAELIFCLRAKAIVFLPKFMPIFLSHLSDDSILKGDDLFLTSIMSATNKLLEAIPLFISLDNLSTILTRICIISFHCKQQLEMNKTTILIVKLKAIRQKLASSIPDRTLYPAVSNCYQELCEKSYFNGIEILMQILSDSFQASVSSTNELNTFFLNVFEFRGTFNSKLEEESISRIENSIINTFVSLVMKYSEPIFRNLFYRILDWGFNLKTNKLNTITFFKITYSLSQRLQSLFTQLARSLFKPCVKLLNATNIIKVNGETENDESGLFFDSDVEKSVLLLEQVLKTLLSIFSFDMHRIATKERFERFELLIQPLVDQLENCIGNWQERCTNLVIPCLAQMAVSAGDDNLWKPLNYQILLKTQNTNPEVRQIALNAVCAIAIKLGDDFVPLLPETVQFLAELLEDDDENVEKCCRKVIQKMEKHLGEPIAELF